MQRAKVRDQKSRPHKSKQSLPQFEHFRNPILNSLMVTKLCTQLAVAQIICPKVFQSHPSSSKVTGVKTRRLWHEFSVSTLQPQFDSTYGYDMMHKAWSGMNEVPYCLSRSSVKFQGHMGRKIGDLSPICEFPVDNSHQNSHMVMKWHT